MRPQSFRIKEYAQLRVWSSWDEYPKMVALMNRGDTSSRKPSTAALHTPVSIADRIIGFILGPLLSGVGIGFTMIWVAFLGYWFIALLESVI
jgi:hypothetical protein